MNLLESVEIHIALSRVATLHLPINEQSPSRIRFQILLQLAKAEFSSVPMSVKSLFASIPHSDTGIRKHFDELLDEGWVVLDNHKDDRRIRYVKPSDQLVVCFKGWLVGCNKIFETMCQQHNV